MIVPAMGVTFFAISVIAFLISISISDNSKVGIALMATSWYAIIACAISFLGYAVYNVWIQALGGM